MATRPIVVATRLRSSSALSSTTVLATEMHSPSTMPCPMLQPHSQLRPTPSSVGQRDLAKRARYDHAAHRKQVRRRKMQADAKHQENDAYLGKLSCYCGIGDKARSERTDKDARD